MRYALVSYWHDIVTILPELKEMDLIFACEQAALDILQAGLSVEKIVSDFDTVSVEALTAFTEAVTILPTRKNETDTTALFLHILEKYPSGEIVVYNEFAGRVDHALALFSLFQQHQDVCIKTPQSLLFYKKPGTYQIMPHKDYCYISFIGLTAIKNIQLKNFSYPLQKESLPPFSDLTVSNEFIGTENGELSFEKGELLVIYSRDNE